MKNKTKVIIIAILIILTVGIAITVISMVNSPSRKISKQLSIAQQYIENGEYEIAIAEFKKVLEIDPYNVDAHLGIIDSYIEIANESSTRSEILSSYESAISYAEEAYKHFPDNVDIQSCLLGSYIGVADLYYDENDLDNAEIYYNKVISLSVDNSLSDKIDYAKKQLSLIEEYRNTFHPEDPEQLADAMDAFEQAEKTLYALAHIPHANYEIRSNKTADELYDMWSPYIEIVEEYLPYCEDQNLKYEAYISLHDAYYITRHSEDLLRIREDICTIFNQPYYSPEGYSTESASYDMYGNVSSEKEGSYTHIYTYDNMLLMKETTENHYFEYTYNSNGLLREVFFHGPGGEIRDVITYEGDTIKISRYWLNGWNSGAYDDDWSIYTCDEYGRIIHESKYSKVDNAGNDLSPRNEYDFDVLDVNI